MVTVGTLVAITIDGFAFGVFLALLGMSITLVFGLGEVLNLAIGAFAVMAVLAANTLVNSGQSLLVASLVGLVIVAALGLVVDRTLLTYVYRETGEQRILLGIFTTLGLVVFLDGFLINGYDFVWMIERFPWLPGVIDGVLRWLAVPAYPASYTLPLELPRVAFGDAVIRGSSLVVILVGAGVFGVTYLFLKRTFLGKAARTVFQDELGAQLVGVNPRRIRSLIFVLSVTIAGFAGLVWALGHTVTVSAGFTYTVFALIVSIVGGVRSLTGAVVAGILLGLVSQYANFFVGSYIAVIILFGAAIVFLLAKPEALQ